MRERHEILVNLGIGAIGAVVFILLQLPLPWILGPAASIMILNGVRNKQVYWPRGFGNTGIMVIAYLLGVTFTSDPLDDGA
jgi:uncharacterized membrane protein AbrB (regulator of aidB expression)